VSRSGYVDSDGENDLAMYGWQANARRMMRGRQGQSFLWELYLSLEALPKKELITGGLVDEDGACCALGAVALRRGIEIPDDLKVRRNEDGDIDEDDADDFYEYVTPLLKIKEMMTREVMYENDEGDQWHWPDGTICHGVPWKLRDTPIRREDTPAERWQRVRRWVVSKLRGIP
jgi:hypothetical protein